MPMSLRQVALAAFLSFAITACAQPPAAQMPVVTPSATHRDHAESAPVTSAKEAPAMSEPATAEPERGPAIPAAELRKRLLCLVREFPIIERSGAGACGTALQVPLSKDPEMRMGFGYDGKTVEGWEYGVSVAKLGRLDQLLDHRDRVGQWRRTIHQSAAYLLHVAGVRAAGEGIGGHGL